MAEPEPLLVLKEALEAQHCETLNTVWEIWKIEAIYPRLVLFYEVTGRPWIWHYSDGVMEALQQLADRWTDSAN